MGLASGYNQQCVLSTFYKVKVREVHRLYVWDVLLWIAFL
jgi:hypothetical protein